VWFWGVVGGVGFVVVVVVVVVVMMMMILQCCNRRLIQKFNFAWKIQIRTSINNLISHFEQQAYWLTNPSALTDS
jgi:hypothetical protein